MLQDLLTNNTPDERININQDEFSVSEISHQIKYLLENNLRSVRIRGEISGLKIAASGHCYFSLKDAGGVLATTCWRHIMASMPFVLIEGMEVIVIGKITAYAEQSKYQLSAERIEPAGHGAFAKILAERKQKLAKEGLFDQIHKQQIPFLPKKIGIITSIAGAVIRDIIHRITDRCPTHLLIHSVNVQGSHSADEVASAIELFNNMDALQKPDLLIIARGGGSIEDLWSFNEEIVVRAAFKSKIPIISAIGHETDYTLLDLVADKRAPTPTAAAEFAVPVLVELRQKLDSLVIAKKHQLSDLLKYHLQRVLSCNILLTQMQSRINFYTQKVDDVSFKFYDALPRFFKSKMFLLQHYTINQVISDRLLRYKTLQYQGVCAELTNKSVLLLNKYENKLNLNAALLASMDYRNVIKRGFAIVKSVDQQVLSSVHEIAKIKEFEITMRDGVVRVRNELTKE